jgi:hypothetical protein
MEFETTTAKFENYSWLYAICDGILANVSEESNSPKLDIYFLAKQLSTDTDKITTCCNFLKDKEYIHFNNFIVSITPLGDFFISNGGFRQTLINNAYDRSRLENLEKTQTKNQSDLNRLTLIIAIGTSVAALYYLLEILKFCFCHK